MYIGARYACVLERLYTARDTATLYPHASTVSSYDLAPTIAVLYPYCTANHCKQPHSLIARRHVQSMTSHILCTSIYEQILIAH